MKLSSFELFLIWLSGSFMLSLILAYIGFFYLWFVILISIGLFLGLVFIKKKKVLKIKKTDKLDKVVLITILFISFLFSFFSEPTIFGGRDEGSLVNAGILLVKDHGFIHEDKLTNQFGEIYKHGKALNFPGFYYNNPESIRTQFLPGYIVWIAIWWGMFGFIGLKFVNFIPFVIFCSAFYGVVKNVLKKRILIAFSPFLLISFFPIFFFFKFTLTEIFFAAFIWSACYFLIKYFLNKSLLNYFLLIVVSLPLPFIRVESVSIIFSLFLIFFFFDRVNFRKRDNKILFLALIFSIILSVFLNFNTYFDTFKGVLEIKNNTEQTEGEPLLGEEGFSFIPDDWEGFYLGKVLLNYNLLPFIVLGLMCIIALLSKKLKKAFGNKKLKLSNLKAALKKGDFVEILPVIMFLFIFIYLIDPNISDDHPWMLRRFVFAIIPIVILYSLILLENWLKKNKLVVLLVLLVTFGYNLYISFPFLNFVQNRGLLVQTKQLFLDFDEKDLILVSQKFSGNGWALISEPMRNVYGYNVVYFFNPKDLEKINKSEWSNIFLISSNTELGLYKEVEKDKIRDYDLNYEMASLSTKAFERPKIEDVRVEGGVYEVK